MSNLLPNWACRAVPTPTTSNVVDSIANWSSAERFSDFVMMTT